MIDSAQVGGKFSPESDDMYFGRSLHHWHEPSIIQSKVPLPRMLPDCNLIKARLQQVLTRAIYKAKMLENANQITQVMGELWSSNKMPRAQLMQT
jgi:hypothetical protein